MALDDRTAFRERLSVPWWSWPILLALAAGLAVEIGLGAPGLVLWLPFSILLPGTLLLLAWLSRIKVRVEHDTFFVDDAKLEMEFIAEVEPLTGTALRDAMSVQLHPLAFVVQRPWIRSAVRVRLNDANDPTPYWVVSTRHPEKLCQALTAAPARGAEDLVTQNLEPGFVPGARHAV